MKLAITADIHIRPRGEHEERIEALSNVLESAGASGARALVVAGDLFDAATGDYSPLEKLVERVPDAPPEILVIPGNHDAGLRARHFRRGRIRVVEAPLLYPDQTDPCAMLVPYSSGASFRDALESAGTFPRGLILVGHGDFVSGGSARSNAYEMGIFMPLTRSDLSAFGFTSAILGHIHAPHDAGPVSYPGSPCPIDRTETGMRSYLLLDTSTGRKERVRVDSPVVHLRETVAVAPSIDETGRVLGELGTRAAAWRELSGCGLGAVRPEITLTGVALSRADLLERVSLFLADILGHGEFVVEAGGLLATDDSGLGTMADSVAAHVRSMHESGAWPPAPYAPDPGEVLARALAILYGNRE